MPPADQDSKKPAPSDSLLSDFDFGDDDFNWDKVGESLAPVLNSEDELPPELRRAVVPEAQPIAPAAPSPSLVAKPSEPEPAKPAEASPKVSPEPSAARAFDPLALPPLEGDAAPLPPILSTGLLGDLDLDLPVPPCRAGHGFARYRRRCRSVCGCLWWLARGRNGLLRHAIWL